MRLAAFTTIYPDALPFLTQWGHSVEAQTLNNFDLWVALDGVEEDLVREQHHALHRSNFVHAPSGSSPVGIRNYALAEVLQHCDAVALVDSDDILLPHRMEAAATAARANDLTACSMELASIQGNSLGLQFDPFGQGESISRVNVFGFSNTTWSSTCLQECLPASADCRLMDWQLAVKAHLMGASVGFDSAPHMLYRQHTGNIAPVCPPFTAGQVMTATELVVTHHEILDRDVLSAYGHLDHVYRDARRDALLFSQVMLTYPGRLKAYLSALNALPFIGAWWSCVANPSLEHLWKS